MSKLTIIVAATKSNGIGSSGRLPWRIPKELSYFARVTTNAPEGCTNAVIMGRKTWESIPVKFRPLPRRLNLVISRDKDYDLGQADGARTVFLEDSLRSALRRLADTRNPTHRRFIIGGASLYSETLSLGTSEPAYVDRILLTRILSPEYECDVFMPDFVAEDKAWRRADHKELEEWAGFDVPGGIQRDNGVDYEFQMWVR